MAKRRTGGKRILGIAIIGALFFYFGLSIWGGFEDGRQQARSDAESAREGAITVDPWQQDSETAHDELRGLVALPERGVRVGVETVRPPADWGENAVGSRWSMAHHVEAPGYGQPGSAASPDTLVITLNATSAADAAGNPLMEPQGLEGLDLYLDGVRYTVATAMDLEMRELALDTEPLVREAGRAVVIVYERDGQGEPTGGVVALVAHLDSDQ